MYIKESSTVKVEELKTYEVLEHRTIGDLNSDSYILRHKKTGARVALLSNDDENKVFYIGFRTPPTDSTGVAHIIEHTVLCGSKDFPVKDPFIELAKGSLNTFLNAMTYPDKTVYPVASCNDADFQNLMHVYLDAVFYPNIYKSDRAFQQEGWHYELKNADDPLAINGVVYNEMKGAYSSADDVLDRYIMNSLYPDNTYSIESGGDPDVIPELTYEQYLDFHRKYYHPSNSYIYLYGNMDMVEKLTYIDENYLSKFDNKSIDSKIYAQKAFEEPRYISKQYSIMSDDKESQNTYLSMNWSVGTSLEPKEYIAFDIIDYCLCSAPGAILRKALLDNGIGKDVYSEYENGICQPFFSVIAKNADACQKEKFEQIIFECLNKVVKDGFDKRSLEAAINADEFKYREADFGRFPKGLLYGLQVLDSWLYDDMKPWIHIEAGETYKMLREELNTSYFEELVQKYLIDNKHRSLFVMEPVKGLTEQKDKERAKQLADYKKTLSKEEIEKIVKNTLELQKYQESLDNPEDLKKIPMLKRSDLKREAEPFIYEERRVGENVLLFHNIFTNGIGYITLSFNIDNVPQNLFPYIGIMKTVLGMVDTKNFTYKDLYNEINIKTGGITAGINIYTDYRDMNQFSPRFEIMVKVLPQNLKTAFDLIKEVLMTSNLDDITRIKEILDEKRSHMEVDLTTAGNRAAALRAMADISSSAAISETVSGITGYRLVEKFSDAYADLDKKDEMHKTLVSNLHALMKVIFRKENLLVSFTGTKKEYGDIENIISDFANGLYTEEVKLGHFNPSVGRRSEAFRTPGQVQYVALAGNFRKEGKEYTGALRVLQSILGYGYLWDNIRVKGGAYGVSSGYGKNGDSYFVTYRDPHLAKSLEVFDKVAEYVKNYDASEREMTQNVIGAIAELDTPKTPSAKGSYGLSAYMCHADYNLIQKHRDQVLDVTVEDIRKLADYITTFTKDRCICVVGSSEKIQNHVEIFDSIEQL